jgi:predicted phage tail protein
MTDNNNLAPTGTFSGGKGKSKTPKEDANTLRSRAVGRMLDLLSEGPIEGLVGGKRGIYINEVSWESSGGKENFTGLTAELRNGDATQEAIPGFPSVEREIGSGQVIRYGNITNQPEIKPEIQISDSLVDAVRVTLQVDALAFTQKDGDIVGNSVQIRIEVKNAFTNYATVITDTISGKTTSPYERAYRINLPKDPALPDMGAPFRIRVSRLTTDSDQIKNQNGTSLSHYTEIIDNKLSYPDTAYVGVTFDTQLFDEGIPRRQYLIDGLKMAVPSNYYPKGIEIENFVPLSQDFTGTSWTKKDIATPLVSQNVVAPDGTESAQVLVPNSTSTTHHLSRAAVVTGMSAKVDHVASVYVKRINAACSGVRFQVYAQSGSTTYGSYQLDLNFTTGAVTYADTSLTANGGRNVGWGCEELDDGWYRLWMAGYPSSTVATLMPRVWLFGSSFGNTTFAGNSSTQYAAVWGFQIHKGVSPYQYLPNTTTAKATGLSAERYYSGNWDGTFKTAWTNNPAWVLFMLLTHPRIGMGQWINESMIDKWALYGLAKYCDELVPDGYGGYEPRFTFNGVIRNRDDAYNVIQNIATSFRGIVYWGAGSTLVSWDAPKDASILVTPANVIDGLFDYKGVGWKARHSAVLVKWNDPNNLYKDAIEVVEDQDLIQKFGWKPLETAAIGCTSRGQAYRWGKWILYTEKYETETVVYKASFDHMVKDGTAVMPGDIIKVLDPSYAGIRNGGRVIRTVRNYLTYSDQVNAASWTKTGVTVTANAVSRQNMMFDRITETTANSGHFVRQDINLGAAKVASGAVHNFSALISRTSDTNIADVMFRITNAAGTAVSEIAFNLDTGNFTLTPGDFLLAHPHAIVVGGNGAERVWRVCVDFTTLENPAENDTLRASVHALDAEGASSYAGNVSRSFLLAQLQISNGEDSVDFINTEASPRQAILVDYPVTIQSSTAYTVSAVLPSGQVEDRNVISPAGERSLIQLATDFSEDPLSNAMWILSSADVEPRLFRVLSVREQESNIVEVTALYHNPQKFGMVERDLKFEEPSFSALSLDAVEPPTNLRTTEYLFSTIVNSIQTAVTLSWTPPRNEPRATLYDVQIKAPGEDWRQHATLSDVSVTIEGIHQGFYSFRVRAVGAIGSASEWQTLEDLELFGLTQKPPNVQNFNMNAVGDQAYLTWTPATDPTVDHYVVKIENVVTDAQWGSGIKVLENIPRTASHVYVPLRFGTYMIKAVSIADVESVSPALVISDVAGINNFNATETVVAEPAFLGTRQNCSVVNNTLVTTPTDGLYPEEAIYSLQGYVDLGEVYTNRLTPTITASGQRADYTMSTWSSLASVERLDGGVENSWSIVIEYATTRANPATATADDWTDWKPLIIGDSTARAYKFRLRLHSYDTSVQVRVGNFQVVIDMPDRVEGQQGIVVPGSALITTGLDVTYANPFKMKPAVAVTVQNALVNDVVALSNETRTGFNIKITNGGTPVSRTINWVAKGYGKA